MKKSIHPPYHPIVVVMTDGEKMITRSSYGQSGEHLKLSVDPKTHSAWTKKRQDLIDRGGRISRFQKRYDGLIFSSKEKNSTPEEAQSAPAQSVSTPSAPKKSVSTQSASANKHVSSKMTKDDASPKQEKASS